MTDPASTVAAFHSLLRSAELAVLMSVRRRHSNSIRVPMKELKQRRRVSERRRNAPGKPISAAVDQRGHRGDAGLPQAEMYV